MNLRQNVLRAAIGISLLGSGLVGLDLPMADAADLNNVRIISQDNGPQIILDLTAPPSDVTVNLNNPKGYAVSFTGRISPALPERRRTVQGAAALKNVAWNVHGSRVTVWIPKTPATAGISVIPLDGPDRLMIRIPERMPVTAAKPTSVRKLTGGISTAAKPPLPAMPVPVAAKPRPVIARPAPAASVPVAVASGVTHRHLRITGPRGPLNINILDVDTTRSDVTVEPVLASTTDLHAKARVTRMVQSHGAVAGINASYFKPDRGTVLGTVILNRELIAGPFYNRVSLGITTDRRLKMDRVSLKGSLQVDTGESVAVDNVNQPRLDRHQSLLYSPRWGKLAPPTPAGHIQVRIRDGEVLAVGTERMPIAADGLVLIAPQDSAAGRLMPGNRISLRLYTVPDWTDVVYAVSGGPYLVHNNQVFVDSRQQAFRSGASLRPAPRTAVGITASNHLLMVTVDGRQDAISTGMTLTEMAGLMKRLGAVEAMNFDGGSSTQMVLKGHLVNSPTVAGGAAVSSALLVRAPALSQPAEIIGDVTNGHEQRARN